MKHLMMHLAYRLIQLMTQLMSIVQFNGACNDIRHGQFNDALFHNSPFAAVLGVGKQPPKKCLTNS